MRDAICGASRYDLITSWESPRYPCAGWNTRPYDINVVKKVTRFTTNAFNIIITFRCTQRYGLYVYQITYPSHVCILLINVFQGIPGNLVVLMFEYVLIAEFVCDGFELETDVFLIVFCLLATHTCSL